jgi:hypothetical protein
VYALVHAGSDQSETESPVVATSKKPHLFMFVLRVKMKTFKFH